MKEVAWWSVYEIGQRLCDRFDDVPAGGGARRTPRVFIAGDACHTHSPKAGQGMNVSMQDGFNLGWKLAAVLRGQSAPAILHTYSAERQAIATELIDFDRDFARMFSAAPKRPASRGRHRSRGVPALLRQAGPLHRRHRDALRALAAHRGGPSTRTSPPASPIGMRFHSAPVIRLADAKPLQLGHALEADGRWRVLLFADATDAGSPVIRAARALRVPAATRGRRCGATRRTAPTSTR